MKIAILIPGLLRAVESNQLYFASLADRYDIFICTNLKSSPELRYFSNPKRVTIIEDNAFHCSTEKSLLRLEEGIKLLQWQKLFIAFNDVCEHEKKYGFFYDAIIKVRTDLQYPSEFSFPNFSKDSNVLYMQGDLIFGANRRVFESISDFFVSGVPIYYGNNLYQKINTAHLAECDLDAAKFHQLKFPRRLLPTKFFNQSFSRQEIRDALIKNAAILEETDENDSDVFFKKAYWKDRKFRNQVNFLHFVLSKNIIVKSFSEHKLRLFSDRKRFD